MIRSIYVALLTVCLSPLAGCRLCSDCGDLDYPTYGGAWQRTTRDTGRVGSIFDPGGAQASDLVRRDSAITPDELERNRQLSEGGETQNFDSSQDEPADGDSGSEMPDESTEQENPIDPEAEFERRKQELRERGNKELGETELEAKVVPGQLAPPLLR